MGGGASAVRDMEEIVACTFLIGKAIAAVSFPDMYNIYHFDAARQQQQQQPQGQCLTQTIGEDGRIAYVITSGVPQQLQQQAAVRRRRQQAAAGAATGGGPRSTLSEEGGQEEDEEEEEQQQAAAPQDAQSEQEEAAERHHVLKVTVGTDTITLRDANKPNDDGWTPLHACCHSSTTAKAGLAIIEWVIDHHNQKTSDEEEGHKENDEAKKKTCLFDGKTKRGPGAFNSDWTPLHMASAYGVEALVERLVQVGADVNTRNSLSWTPLQEACHRGFLSIIKVLIRGGADTNYIPDEKACRNSPFLRAPAQSPLGEVCRCGFTEAVKVLLDAGANKDQRNYLGWTPLHEAAFFNQMDVVQMLLVYGADPTIRNNQGALPYHLASLPDLRRIIREIGGEAATLDPPAQTVFSHLKVSPPPSPDSNKATAAGTTDAPAKPEIYPSRTLKSMNSKLEPDEKEDEKEEDGVDKDDDHHRDEAGGGQFLHRGGMLGDLPAFGTGGSQQHSNNKSGKAAGGGDSHGGFAVTDEMKRRKKRQVLQRHHSASSSSSSTRREDSMAEDKNGGGAGEVPKEFMCEICLRPLRHPMRTPYGNVYERDVIKAWVRKNGSIDPLTGRPLAVSELKEDAELAARIKEFHSHHSEEQANEGTDDSSQASGHDQQQRLQGNDGNRGDGVNSSRRIVNKNASLSKSVSLPTSTSSSSPRVADNVATNDNDLYDF